MFIDGRGDDLHVAKRTFVPQLLSFRTREPIFKLGLPDVRVLWVSMLKRPHWTFPEIRARRREGTAKGSVLSEAFRDAFLEILAEHYYNTF